MKNYRYINKNPLSCKDYKSLETHKKLFPVYRKTYKNSRSSSSKHIINSYLEKIDENKSNYISIFTPEIRPALQSEHNGVNMNETYLD